jgi:ABC-type multidrug transport system ATPase subunit
VPCLIFGTLYDYIFALTIELLNIAKKFSNQWILKNFNYHFEASRQYAILGRNGSGKSSLLKIIGGLLTPDKGKIVVFDNHSEIASEAAALQTNFCAPYQQIIEEFTLHEMLEFHAKFRTSCGQLSNEQILAKAGLEQHRNKKIHELSSGMKQRFKLSLAIMFESMILLLDEPLSNLDKDGIQWYQEQLNNFSGKRLCIICSNHNQDEYPFSRDFINL